jgi:hypothetical protein
MNRKLMLFSVVAVLTVMVLVVVSAVAVMAMVDTSSTQAEEVNVETVIENVPLQVEPVSQSQVVEPAGHEDRLYTSNPGSGCRFHEAKQQLTQTPAEKLTDQPLAQVGQ